MGQAGPPPAETLRQALRGRLGAPGPLNHATDGLSESPAGGKDAAHRCTGRADGTKLLNSTALLTLSESPVGGWEDISESPVGGWEGISESPVGGEDGGV